jgi:hypothetical protein
MEYGERTKTFGVANYYGLVTRWSRGVNIASELPGHGTPGTWEIKAEPN